MSTADTASPVPVIRNGHRIQGPGPGTVLARVTRWRQELVLLATIAALFIVVGSINPMFLSGANVTTIFSGTAYIAIAAIGMSMLIISGHIDVSVGALIGVLAMIRARIGAHRRRRKPRVGLRVRPSTAEGIRHWC